MRPARFGCRVMYAPPRMSVAGQSSIVGSSGMTSQYPSRVHHPHPRSRIAESMSSATAVSRPSLYSTYVGKKYAMAISGVVLMAFVLLHMIGNLKIYFGASSLDRYSHWLRTVGEPALPEQWLLFAVRAVLLVALIVHVHAAYVLTKVNRQARPDKYRSKRDYVAADFASRTMRWTGVIVLLFVVFHLLELTWGMANSEFVRGDPYNNLVYSLQRPVVAIAYSVAMIALAFHLYHGAWSMFQSMGINNPRINKLRRSFAIAFAGLILVGNLSFPILVQAHAVDVQCPNAQPTTAPCKAA